MNVTKFKCKVQKNNHVSETAERSTHHYNLWATEILQDKKGIRGLNLRHIISFQSPGIDLKYRMLRITSNNPNFYSKNNHYLNFIAEQDNFSFNLSATSNFRSMTFSLWWIYNRMTNTLKPSTIAGSAIVCVCMCMCVCARAHKHMSKKLQDIYIYYGYFSTMISLFLNQRTACETHEMKNTNISSYKYNEMKLILKLLIQQ